MTERKDNQAQLGCGTLIVIAIIVMIFSGDRGSSKVRKDVQELNRKIERLEKKIDELSKKLDEQRGGSPAVAAQPQE